MGDQMEQLVDAFRGLATEGNTGNYLADVEAIVNNYFVRSGDGTEEDRTMPPNESPIRPTRGHDISVSPVKEVSMASSGGSLGAWGVVTTEGTEEEQRRHIDHTDADFYARSVGWHQRQVETRDKKRNENAERDLEDCTWKPSINELPYTQTGRMLHGKVEDRLHASAAIKHERLQQQRKLRKEIEVDGCTFKPNVNKNASVSIQSRYMDSVGMKSVNQSNVSNPFERLYAARKKKEDDPPPGSAPVLYTTYSPSRNPKGSKTQMNLDLSLDEIEAAERELLDIELLLNNRLKQSSFLVVDSNYIDSDDDGYSDTSGGTAAKVDFDTFLLRQNAFEERKRANLAFIEADTAPSLHPTIQPRSRKLPKPSLSTRVKPGADQKELRLRKLCTESTDLRSDIAKLQEECDALLRKVSVVSSTLPKNKERTAALSALRAELNGIRLQAHTDEEREGDIKINPQDEALKRAFLTKTVAKLSQRVLQGKADEERGIVLQGWVREMLDVKAGLTEMKVRSTKVRDALNVEKANCMGARDGCIPWETMAKMEFKRQEGPKMEQGDKAEPERMEAQIGDKVLARREDWQAWEKGTLEGMDGDKAVVLLDGASKPQMFPATAANVVVQQGTGHRFKPQLRRKWIETCVKTREEVKVFAEGKEYSARVLSQTAGGDWVVALNKRDTAGRLQRATVSESAIMTSKDLTQGNYGHTKLGTYIDELGERKKEQSVKREQQIIKREIKETLECTHTPSINTTPQYITRIAHSMQLLRGETTK